jgi:hypothetical protein
MKDRLFCHIATILIYSAIAAVMITEALKHSIYLRKP